MNVLYILPYPAHQDILQDRTSTPPPPRLRSAVATHASPTQYTLALMTERARLLTELAALNLEATISDTSASRFRLS